MGIDVIKAFFETMPLPPCASPPCGRAEPLISTAPPTQCFVMVECPPPWGQTIQEAESLPALLQAMVSNPRYKQHGIRFFLISDDETPRSDDSSPSQPRVLIFQQPKGFAAEYEAIELQVSTLDEAAIALQRYFAGEPLPQALTRNPLRRDLFICTHGQYHKCCGRYGYPFYQQAQQLKQQWDLPALRIWQVSHIGGHRFAPTLIDLPQGRYYGRLSADGLKLLIRQQGDWRSLLPYYRGWSLLPKSMQLLERQHWQTKGWSWLAQQIYCPSPELQPTGPAVVHTTPRRGNARMAAATSKEPASGTRL